MKNTKLILSLLLIFIFSSSVEAICAVHGYIFDSEGNPVTENVEVVVTNLNDGVGYPAQSESGVYSKVLHSCRVGLDVINVKIISQDAETQGIASAPYTELNLTYTKVDIAASSVRSSSESAPLAPDESCKEISVDDAKPFIISDCDTALFSFKGAIQKFTVAYIKNNIVAGIFEPMHYPTAAYLGKEKQVDLDNNGANDLSIAIASIDGDSAVMVFKELVEKIALPAAESNIEMPSNVKLNESSSLTGINLLLVSLILVSLAIMVWLIVAIKKH